MKNVYFFCSGDSNRAQLAQGFAEVYLKDDVHYISTSFPDAKPIQPLAVLVMREIGINIAHCTSPAFDEASFKAADYIISICEDPIEQTLSLPPQAKHIHIQIDDPLLSDDYVEQLTAYRQVRDRLGVEIKRLSEHIKKELAMS